MPIVLVPPTGTSSAIYTLTPLAENTDKLAFEHKRCLVGQICC